MHDPPVSLAMRPGVVYLLLHHSPVSARTGRPLNAHLKWSPSHGIAGFCLDHSRQVPRVRLRGHHNEQTVSFTSVVTPPATTWACP